MERKRVGADLVLFADMIALVVTGLVFVYSASYYGAEQAYGNKYYFLIKQGAGVLFGIIGCTIMSLINLKFVKRAALPLTIVSLLLLGVVFIPGVGVENYGAKRWIGFGGFTFQPSELAKFALVIFAAWHFSKEKVDSSRLKGMLPVVLVGLGMCVLIIMEPNMSITVCTALILFVMLYIGGMKKRLIFIGVGAALVAIPLLIIAEPYRLLRLFAFLDPWASPKEEGYQLIQSLYALGSGGWFGVGLFNSRQKYLFLPFAESDFVFSIIGEEIGFIGAVCVLSLFAVFAYRGIRVAVNSKNKFNAYLSGGITAVVLIQALVNVAVVTGSIPPTGLPLPFISYGGSSIAVFMSATGLLLNLSKQVEF
ncbi:MAG: putative lipid II flippase FtsW [Clostridia bacterium]|nr:putative lipid II flippase FtsW [Clostridia bacterium]